MTEATTRLTAPSARPAATDIAHAARESADARYAAENRAGMAEWSAWFEEHGLPLAEYRQF